MPDGYDELLNAFDDQGLGAPGMVGYSPDMIHPALPPVRVAPATPATAPAREPGLAGVATASLLAGLLLGALFGRP